MMIFIVHLIIALAAGAEPFQATPHDTYSFLSGDGAVLSLIHVAAGNPQAPVVLIEPGLLENAAMFEEVAREFHERGYDVYVGQNRFTTRLRGKSPPQHQADDGLEQVLFEDFPAHLRAVIAQHPNTPVNLFGHSMGGMAILAGLSDPALARELTPHVKAVTLVAAPTDLHGIPLWLHLECKSLMPLFKVLVKLTGPYVSAQASTFDYLEKARESRNPVVAAAAKTIEGTLISLFSFMVNRTIVSNDRMSPEARRRFWSQDVAAYPMRLLLDFAQAAASREFLGRQGGQLMFPERITVPVEIIRAMRDQFASPESQLGLFNALGSRTKRLIDLEGMRHVDPFVADLPRSDFVRAAVDFHDQPEAASLRAPHPAFQGLRGACERYLVTDRL